MNNNLKILLIGGTGVLSSAVTSEALKSGIHVTMINRGNRASRIPSGVDLIKANKNDRSYIEQQLIGKYFDAIIDFLCFTPSELEYSFNLYSQFTNQYLFISSCAVYKGSVSSVCDEKSPKIEESWSYSIDKYACEQRLIQLATQKGVNYTIIRPAITYDDTRLPYGISPRYGYHWTMVARILSGKPILTWNNGTNYRNMMRVEDFAVGVIGLIGNKQAFNDDFNICGDEAPSYQDVLDAISDYIGISISTVDIPSEFYAREIPERAGEMLADRAISVFFSNEKIKHVVPQFKQKIQLKEGIRMTLDAYKTRDYQHGIDWKFDGETDRVIEKYVKYERLPNSYNLHFVDYLNNATRANRKAYLLARYQPRWISKMLLRLREQGAIFLHFLQRL